MSEGYSHTRNYSRGKDIEKGQSEVKYKARTIWI
jgi:hypothetical protein